MRFWTLAFLVAVTASMVACSGANTPAPAAVATPVALAINWWQPLAPSVGAPTAIELYAQQFLDFSHADTTASAATTASTWASSSDAVALATATPGPFGGTQLLVAPSPSAGQTHVIYQHPGVTTLTATAPGATGSILVLTYASVDFGCDFRASGAFPAPDATLGAAAYATVPGATSPCEPGTGPVPSPVTFHFPFGATLLTDGNPEFRLMSASLWRNDFTTIDNATLAASTARVILFKTATGTVVKFDAVQRYNTAQAIIGFYEATDATGQFPY